MSAPTSTAIGNQSPTLSANRPQSAQAERGVVGRVKRDAGGALYARVRPDAGGPSLFCHSDRCWGTLAPGAVVSFVATLNSRGERVVRRAEVLEVSLKPQA